MIQPSDGHYHGMLSAIWYVVRGAADIDWTGDAVTELSKTSLHDLNNFSSLQKCNHTLGIARTW